MVATDPARMRKPTCANTLTTRGDSSKPSAFRRAQRDRLSFTPDMKEAVGEGRPRPGKRPRAARVQDQAVRGHGRRHACRFAHRVELVGDHAERDAVEVQAPRAHLDRASVQSSAHHSARGSRRGDEDRARSHPAGHGVLRVHRQEADPAAERDSGACREPASARSLQGGHVS